MGRENTVPFEGYKKVVPKTQRKSDGKQKKAPDTGLYTDQENKTYYIKKSEEFPADNIAEVASGSLMGLVIGDQAVQYKAVRNKSGDGNPELNTVYIASEVDPKFKTLKESVELPDKVIGADLLTIDNKKTVYNKLTPNQKKGMANILAACLWVKEPDCQYGNILIKENVDSVDSVKKFDNGWGLVDICKPEHSRVNLFEKQAPFSLQKTGTHGRIGIPTNHFNDYPDIIRSQDFVDALDLVVKNATPEKIKEQVDNVISNIISDYDGSTIGKEQALRLFAEHIFLKNIPKNQKTEDFIKEKLKSRLQERADSIAILQCMLKVDLAIKDKEHPLTPEKAKALLKELVKISGKLDKSNDLNLSVTTGKIIPPFDPPFVELLRKLKVVSAKEKVDKKPVINKKDQQVSANITQKLKDLIEVFTWLKKTISSPARKGGVAFKLSQQTKQKMTPTNEEQVLKQTMRTSKRKT